MLKSHTCGELSVEQIGSEVTLAGWVHRVRDHGGVVFIDLRDRFGITQVTTGEDAPAELVDAASNLHNEYVVQVHGTVQRRPEGFENPNLKTGEIEVVADSVNLLSESKTPPFYISGKADDVDEALRLKYRYLDLRRPSMTENMVIRHNITRFIREFLSERDFLEVETPILLKSTPEGARDFVVPSRLQPHEFYALPQSPQQIKQLLMVAGIERYFQIARCFRDEDLRADRQLEFTQLDMEMSFVEPEDVCAIIEEMLIVMCNEMSDKRIQQIPFPVITYAEAMEKYGVDRPDIRFGQELFDLSEIVANSEFGVFSNAVKAGGQVKGVVYPGGSTLARRELDDFTPFVAPYGAKGVAWIVVTGQPNEEGDYTHECVRSQIAKFLSPEELDGIIKASGAVEGDLILMVADKADIVAQALSNLRLDIGKRAGLIDPDLFAFCWVIDFPLLEYDEEEERWQAVHHPFTSALDSDWDKLETDPGATLAKAYDVVLNGWEIGGGSIRIHRSELQDRLFTALGISKEEAQAQFGHLLEAFQYGAPPHGGVALGLDRLVALFAGTTSIRDVIAFPKTAAGTDLMLDSPSKVSDQQLKELHISLRPTRKSSN